LLFIRQGGFSVFFHRLTARADACAIYNPKSPFKMKKITLPCRLHSPFIPAINSFAVQTEAKTCQWLRRFGLLKNEEQVEYYRLQGFAYMVGRMFPHTDEKRLAVLTDLNTLLFILDDQFDHTSDHQKQDMPANRLKLAFLRVLRFPDNLPSQEPIFLALSDIARRLRKLGKKGWAEQFIQSVADIFEAAEWQETNVAKGLLPPVREYTEKRRYLGAANVATISIPFAESLYLPDYVLNHPGVNELTRLCENTVCWANDLFSLSKEIGHGDGYNMVTMLQNERSINQDEAIEQTIALHDEEVKRFISIAGDLSALKGLRPEHMKDIQSYVDGLTAIMRGNIDWSDNETTRYEYQYSEVNVIA
jgi:hypothetical protein